MVRAGTPLRRDTMSASASADGFTPVVLRSSGVVPAAGAHWLVRTTDLDACRAR